MCHVLRRTAPRTAMHCHTVGRTAPQSHAVPYSAAQSVTHRSLRSLACLSVFMGPGPAADGSVPAHWEWSTGQVLSVAGAAKPPTVAPTAVGDGCAAVGPGAADGAGSVVESGWWCPQPIAKRLHDVARQCHIGHGLQCAAPQVCAGILTCTQQANGKRNVVFSDIGGCPAIHFHSCLCLGGGGRGIQWLNVPSHVGVHGNAKADKLADIGGDAPPDAVHQGVPLTRACGPVGPHPNPLPLH
eukprot:CAMPEP_0174283268 /NCGR_PEP_ID=MMETSP0809-20121228/3937_1 /TAXON_ID=73025 ORGANISM="Eutreptiella gymnastica-like, Strain CCMP1594" /NCGR_SAMPLE_ID=MMETSP0809 /ASSEMBLY_ACC=CAM_ASM_000658 /LENGTH=241 /DNA_ID=CAMNT_0015378089 /DNA_START=133 /DNA_END=858 /DNA_ORIENTATION=-